MSIYPTFFLIVFIIGSTASIFREPIWGLLLYIFVYFNIPNHQWWGNQLPNLRWSLIIAIILIGSCIIHQNKLSKISFKKNIIGKWLLTFLILMIIIMPFSIDPNHSLIKIYDFLRYIVIYFIINKVVTSFEKYKAVIIVLLFCTFYISVLAHHYFDGSRLDGVGLPDASSANMLAGLFVLLIPFYVVIILTENNWQRYFAMGCLVFVINAFVMCGSRGAFLGIVMQGLFSIYFLRSKIGIKKTIGCCMIVFIGMYFLMSDNYIERLFDTQQGLADGSLSESSAGRWEVWKYGILMASDFPLGTGGDGFMNLSGKYLPESLIEHHVGARASHNTYLLVLVEQGIIGISIYLGFILTQFILLRNSQKALLIFIKIRSNIEQRKIYFHLFSLQIALVGFWTTCFFADRLYFEAIYIIVALIQVTYNLANKLLIDYKNDQIASNQVNTLKGHVDLP